MAIVIGGLFVVVGLFVVRNGASEFRTVYHVLTNDPVSVRELPNRSGPVEIEGTATTDDDHTPVRSPFTDTECLVYEYEVGEYRSRGKHSSWETLDEGIDGVPFVVEDDTGAVRVEPAGADLRLADHTTRVDGGDEPPERIAEYVASTEAVDSQDGSVDLLVTELGYGNDQRFVERRLEPGESVYVYGTVTPTGESEWGSRLVGATVGDGEAIPEFVVSDTSERGTAWRIGKQAVWLVAFGLVFAGFGVAAVVLSLI